jgi:hypothetical protein
MATTNRLDDLRRAVAEAAEALARETAHGGDQSASPSVGDLYVFDLAVDAAIEWLVVREHPDDPGLLLMVPADDFPLAGTPDVALPHDLIGRPFTLRCGEGLWLPRSLCLPRLRVGTVPDEGVRAIRRKLAELVRGQAVGSDDQRSVDVDPEYETWIDLVAQARELLQRRADPAPAEKRDLVIRFDQLTNRLPAELRSDRPYALAAESGGPLHSALSQAVTAIDVRYHEVAFGSDGKLILMAEENGVRGVWTTSCALSPPRLLGLDQAGGPREASWREGPEHRLRRAEPRFPWVDDRVVLEIDSEPPQRLIIQR